VQRGDSCQASAAHDIFVLAAPPQKGIAAPLRDDYVGRLMMALQAFVDDSGDENTYVLGGFIAPIKVQEKLYHDWSMICKERPRIGYYRTNDAIGLKACFLNWNQDDRNGKIARLSSVIPTENCYGIASYLSKSDFEELIIDKAGFPPMYDNPYFLCAFYLVAWVWLSFPLATKIDFIFDSQGKVGKQFETIFDSWLKSIFPRLGKCFHIDDRGTPPLQAADMYAAWIRRKEFPRVQIWTAADKYLSCIQLKDFRVERTFFENIVRYRTENFPEIQTFFEKMGIDLNTKIK